MTICIDYDVWRWCCTQMILNGAVWHDDDDNDLIERFPVVSSAYVSRAGKRRNRWETLGTSFNPQTQQQPAHTQRERERERERERIVQSNEQQKTDEESKNNERVRLIRRTYLPTEAIMMSKPIKTETHFNWRPLVCEKTTIITNYTMSTSISVYQRW